jgi:hypothetical protein
VSQKVFDFLGAGFFSTNINFSTNFQPKSLKQSKIIDKIAMFVVKQGPQMEIIIKAKQKTNAEQVHFYASFVLFNLDFSVWFLEI